MTATTLEKSKTTYRKPRRIFEVSGNVDPKSAYYIRLENVTNSHGQDIKTMVDQGRYSNTFLKE